MPRFTHLHVHSHYSLLEAVPKISDLIESAKKFEMKTLALTDNCNLYGAIEFYKECTAAGIKPIIGIDAYVAPRSRLNKESAVDTTRTRLILLAKNMAGYKNLIKLVTAAHFEGFYYKPRIDKELIERHKEGLVCISPAKNGDIARALKNDDRERAMEEAKWYQKTFDSDFFIEITEPEKMKSLIDFAHEVDTPIVASRDVYFIHEDDRAARNTLLSIQNTNWGDRGEIGNENENLSFDDPKKIEKSFSEEALESNEKIAAICNLKLELGKWLFPNFVVESGLSHDEELRRLAYEGLERRGMEKTPATLARLEYELKVIKDKGYAPYFLVVGDLMNYAHKNNILTTIRGSVAGSLVTYAAHITNVDPLKYKLPFERFLNPERPSAPDIDMDFADNRRDEMITYAKEKYGHDNVAQIGTFGTMAARGAVRDVTRALGYPYTLGDTLSKLIPIGAQGFPMTIDRALKEVPELAKMYKDNEDATDIIDMAKKIEGGARHISVHAAGVVISPMPLTELVPLQYDTKSTENIITQYDMYSIEEAGLLKFDFLGIKNLAILADAVRLVEKLNGIEIDIENVPIDDKKTFEMLARGETIGVFQLNGTGMTKFLKELKPNSILDINAMVALYRPGPIESIPQYIERKHNPALITFLDPRLKDILSESYGVITYQDDVMLTAINLAGYSWLEADKLRKAMGKKIPAEMEAQKGKLIEGLVKNGMSQAKADQLWKLIEPFAAYGFNKAHAASYGKVAYQTAYMKANYPVIYMSAVLTADSGDVDKIAETIAECKRMKIPVLPPSVNESFSEFTVVREKNAVNETTEKIRFGLYTIKNFGETVGETIINERKKNGRFTSISNFLNRIKDKNLNKKSLESLTKTGALDEFGERGLLLGNLDRLLAYSREKHRGPENQESLFGLMADQKAASDINDIALDPAPPATQEEKLAWERELLGLYVSGHPLDRFKDKLQKHGGSIAKVKESSVNGGTVVVAGLIEEIKEFSTKNGEGMAFIKIADYSGNMEAVAFPRTKTEFSSILVAENCVAIKGKMSNRNGVPSVLIEKVKKL